jgi:hypothetical protein
MIRVLTKVGLLVLLLLGLPLLGIVLTGQPIGRYLEFPPQTLHVYHPPFSWPMFITLTVLVMGSVGPFVVLTATSRLSLETRLRLPTRFPGGDRLVPL